MTRTLALLLCAGLPAQAVTVGPLHDSPDYEYAELFFCVVANTHALEKTLGRDLTADELQTLLTTCRGK